MNFRKNSKGITLIALVITIIVLLILAGISLKLISGNSGILKRTQNAETKMREATIKEDVEMLVAGKSIDYYTTEISEPTLGEYLVKNSPDEGFEGRDDSRIYFESIEEGIVYITHEDKNGNKTFLTMNLDGSNVQIVGSGNSNETIDVIAPTLQITSTTTQSITFTSTDRVGVIYYQITEENSEPSNWESVEPTKKLEKTIFDLENNKTYYLWVKDEAGNVHSKDVITADFEMLSHEIEWNGTTATITVTSPKTGVQYKIGTSGTWTDYSETNKPSVASGTEVFFQATDGKNSKQYSSVTPLWTGTVTYDANEGSGDVPESQEIEHTKIVEIDFSQKPTKDGSVFLGWAKNNPKAETPDYSENGTKQFTMGTENVTLYAVWELPITADSVSKNPTSYFGKTVNYTPPNNATSVWQIFYADADNIYLITKDFVPISKMPAGKGGTTLTASGTYSAKLNTIATDYAGTSDIGSSNPARKWLSQLLAQYSKTELGAKALAYLVDTNQFSVFADSNLADYAIAGPTFELFVRSYNVIKTDIPASYTVSSSGYSYRCNLKDPSNPPSSPGYMKNIQDFNGLYNSSSGIYWSLPGVRGGYPIALQAASISPTMWIEFCFRPLVCLKNGAILEKQANGTFDVKLIKEN